MKKRDYFTEFDMKKWFISQSAAKRTKIIKGDFPIIFSLLFLFLTILVLCAIFNFNYIPFLIGSITFITGTLYTLIIYCLYKKWDKEQIKIEISRGEFRDNMELEKKKEQLKKEISQNSIKKIITDFDKFEKNDKLNTIVNNFIKKNPFYSIELISTPKRNYYGHSIPLFSMHDIDALSDSDRNKIYYSFTTPLIYWQNDSKCLDYNQTMYFIDPIDLLHDNFEDDGYGVEEYNEINYEEEIEFLYNSIINQNIIKDVDLTSFYIYLNEKYHNNRIITYQQIANKYNLSPQMSNQELLETLVANNIDEKDRIYYLSLKIYNEENVFPIFYDCIIKSISELERFYDKLKINKKQEEYINSLLNDYNQDNVHHINLETIDKMTGIEFENFIAKLFTALGYKTRLTKSSGDQGIDVIAIKNNTTTAIQVKCYSGVVGNHAIMEAVAGMKIYNADKCLVVTNSTFTKSAKELAKVNGVELWDRQILKNNIDIANI